jgi:hypothetical protein
VKSLQERALTSSRELHADRFGLPVVPKYFDNIERYRHPDSRQELNASSAALLLKYLTAVESGLLFPRVIHQSAVILWLVDVSGAIWFCVEEVYKEDSGTKILPRIDNVVYPKGYEKLGHPALVLAKKARIGGEIRWSGKSQASRRWIISNKSGRYGIRPDIKRNHLEAANSVFQSFGINFEIYYIPYDG